MSLALYPSRVPSSEVLGSTFAHAKMFRTQATHRERLKQCASPRVRDLQVCEPVSASKRGTLAAKVANRK